MSKRCRIAQVGLWLFVLGASQAHSQNLLSNPNFDASLAGWTHSDPDGWQWSSTQGSPEPGSAFGTNTYSTAHVVLSLKQCVPATPGRLYRFGAVCRNPSGQSSAGGCSTHLTWFSGSACTGSRLAYGYSPRVETLGVWADALNTAVSPPGTTSVEFSLFVSKDEAGGSRTARFDSAFLYKQAAPVRGDLDGDRHADLVLHNTVTGDDRLWTMNGVDRLASTLFAPQIPSSYSIVGSDDFNQDGKSDLLLRNNLTGVLQFWYMDGASQLPYPYGQVFLSQTPPPGWGVAASGDFDHDGWPDLLLRNVLTQKLAVWTVPQDGPMGILTPTPDQAADANWSVAAALDFDDDGNRDLLWYNSTSGKIVLWRLDANLVRTAGEFTSPDSAGNNNWQVLAGGDYGLGPGGVANSNDIVWRNSTSGKFVVWHMDPGSVPLTRTSGEFTNPDGPAGANPTEWTIAGPK